jgi:putative nucleotidyltransferase with HDIG domain
LEVNTLLDRFAVVRTWDREKLADLSAQAGMVLLAMLFVLSSAVLVSLDTLGPGSQPLVNLAVGEVAPEDIRAPYRLSYESAVATAQARQIAMNNVRDVYDPPDPGIARQQVQLARQILDYLADVRADEYATPELLAADIQAISALSLTEEESRAILAVPTNRWPDIDQQVVNVLERVMRDEIRNDNLRLIRQNLPNMVSVSFTEAEVAIITAIVEGLIRTNTFYNEESTRQARQAAADSVPPEVRTFAQGQLIIREGAIVTEADLEALAHYGLLYPQEHSWQEFASALLVTSLMTIVFGLYLTRFYPQVSRDTPTMILLGAIFLLVLAGARLAGPERVVQPYLYPAAALGLLFATLVGPQIAILGMFILAILVGLIVSNPLPLVVMTGLGGLTGVLSLRSTERLNNYFVAGTFIGLTNAAVVLVFFLTGYPTDSLGALTLVGAGLLNGLLAAAVTLAGLYLISNLFNVTTSLKLIELNQPNQPLLQRLLREAPGTYQHCLQVANLAELAAERIGANATLTRVGALYHDVGKMHAPHFFIENQADGINPHDALNDPRTSARIIIDHVMEGQRLARKYHLPARIRDFIVEHHGTTRALYFYRKAVEQAGGNEALVNAEDFTYPGPHPQSRESAILMLADGSESSVRACRPRNKQEIAEAVKSIFELRLAEGQLNDSGLTLHDLQVIQSVFVETLQGVFHPRITYPTPVEPDVHEAAPPSLPNQPHARAEEAIPLIESHRRTSTENPKARPAG